MKRITVQVGSIPIDLTIDEIKEAIARLELELKHSEKEKDNG